MTQEYSADSENGTARQVNSDYPAIVPVPAKDRHMGWGTSITTWAGITLQPATWTVGGSMILCGLVTGIWALVIGTCFVFFLVGLYGLMCYKTGVTSSAMTRFTLGVRGSRILTVASIVNSIGWVAVCSYLAAITISYILKLYFGTPAYGEPGSVPVMVISCLVIVFLMWFCVGIGGSKTLKVFQTVMIAALAVFSIVIFVCIFRFLTWDDIVNFVTPEDQRVGFFTGFDTLVSGTVTIAFFAGDLARYAKSGGAVTAASAIGGIPSLIAFGLMAIFGIILAYVQTGEFSIDNANPSSLAMSLGLGVVAFLVVLFSTVTTSMMDIYSIINNTSNLMPKMSFRKISLFALIISLAFCWIPSASMSFMDFFFVFLNFIGALFPPMIVMVLTDYYLIHKGKYNMADIDRKGGQYWYKNGFNVVAVVVWLIGAVIYYMCSNYLKTGFSKIIISMSCCFVIYLTAMKIWRKKKEA